MLVKGENDQNEGENKPSQVLGRSMIIEMMILPKLLFFNTKLLLLSKNKLSEWKSVRNGIRFASSVLN